MREENNTLSVYMNVQLCKLSMIANDHTYSLAVYIKSASLFLYALRIQSG